jgi:hypothetical protein
LWRGSVSWLCIVKYLTTLGPGRILDLVLPEKKGLPEDDPPIVLHDRAMENIRFIRTTMENAGSFTAVPGLAQILIGLTALATAWIASHRTTEGGWFLTWIFEAAIAVTISAAGTVLKSRAKKIPLDAAPTRRFLAGFAPPLVAAAILTPVLFREGLAGRLPGAWILLFGAGVVTGGAMSIRIVPVMGFTFMVAGTTSLLLPAEWGNLFMAASFGGLLIVFGGVIAWRHGG